MRNLAILLLSLGLAVSASAAPVKNGFDLAGALVPAGEILPGGPQRDGIPAIDRPRFLPADEAPEVRTGDRILGLRLDGQARAYPIAILNWHEIVNDRFGDLPVAVTYCPLCGTGMAFRAEAGGKPLQFGVSGLLYNSDVLLYDRQGESLWSQIDRRAISGPHKGERLEALPLEHTTWGDWQQRYPDTLVLSRDTGETRNYDRDPYAGYENERGLYFPVRFKAQGYHPKERVLGLEIDGRFKAYPFAELAKSRAAPAPPACPPSLAAKTDGEVRDHLGGQPITVRFDPEHGNATAEDAQGRPIPAVVGFWFAWYAFHPDTLVYKAKPRSIDP